MRVITKLREKIVTSYIFEGVTYVIVAIFLIILIFGYINLKLGKDESLKADNNFNCNYFECDVRCIHGCIEGPYIINLTEFDEIIKKASIIEKQEKAPIITGASNIDRFISRVISEESGWYEIDKTGLHNGGWMADVGCDLKLGKEDDSLLYPSLPCDFDDCGDDCVNGCKEGPFPWPDNDIQ